MDEAGAREERVANPPKVREGIGRCQSIRLIPSQVLFHDQHGHPVAHNPSTLEKKG